MRFTAALCRLPGPEFARGLTTSDLPAPPVGVMARQHRQYVAALAAAGLEVEVLPALPGHPDAHFVEDTAVVLPGVAVISRPGAPTRRGEVDSVAVAVGRRLPLLRIAPPGTLDGGDVLQVGRRFFVGLSGRTNAAGAEQLAAWLRGAGFEVAVVPVGAGLHLKSGANAVDEETLLVTAALAAHPAFRGLRRVIVPAGEEYAANVLRVNDHLLVPRGFPRTRDLLAGLGIELLELEMGGARALDGGLTCLSLRFPAPE